MNSRKQCFTDTTKQILHVNLLGLRQHILELHKLKTDKVPSLMKRGGHKVPSLAEELMAFEC